jgi:hypothetical protein
MQLAYESALVHLDAFCSASDKCKRQLAALSAPSPRTNDLKGTLVREIGDWARSHTDTKCRIHFGLGLSEEVLGSVSSITKSVTRMERRRAVDGVLLVSLFDGHGLPHPHKGRFSLGQLGKQKPPILLLNAHDNGRDSNRKCVSGCAGGSVGRRRVGKEVTRYNCSRPHSGDRARPRLQCHVSQAIRR